MLDREDVVFQNFDERPQAKDKWALMEAKLGDIFKEETINKSDERIELDDDDDDELFERDSDEIDGPGEIKFAFDFTRRTRKHFNERSVSLIERKDGRFNNWFRDYSNALDGLQLYCEKLESEGHMIFGCDFSLGKFTWKHNNNGLIEY